MRLVPPLIVLAVSMARLAASDWNRSEYPGGEFEWFGVQEPPLWQGEAPDGAGAVANFATGGYEENLKLRVAGRDITLSRLEWRDSGSAANGFFLTGATDSRLILKSSGGSRPSLIAYNTRITLAIDLGGMDGIEFNLSTDPSREVRGTIMLAGVNNDYQGGSWIGGMAQSPDAKKISTVLVARGSRLGSGDVHILAGGVVQANWPGAIAPEAAVTVADGGKLVLSFKSGSMNVKSLELGGKRVPAGMHASGDPAVAGFVTGEGSIEVRE